MSAAVYPESLTAWWASPLWRAYEVAYGDAPGTRSRLLASATWHTQLLDLTLPESALWSGLEHGNRQRVRKAERAYSIVVDPAGDLITPFRAMHIQESGRETRSLATWEMQRAWCSAGNGLIVAAQHDRTWAGFSYWIVSTQAAYYASSVSVMPHLMPALIWRAICELKARGVEQLEMGWCAKPGDNEKDLSISKFKRGFGGRAVPIVAAERRFP